MTDSSTDSRYFDGHGLLFRAPFRLPGYCRDRPEPCGAEPDVEITIGHVADALNGDSQLVGGHEFSSTDVLFKDRDVGRFLISSGRRIICDPRRDADLRLMKAFIAGPVMAILLHQRRLMPLHASCIAHNGKAIAFVGGSGSGKSTTAMMFHNRGYELISDDILTLRFDDEDDRSPPTVYRVGRAAKLWEDAVRLLNVANGMGDKEHSGTAKRTFSPSPMTASAGPQPAGSPQLAAVFILRWIFPEHAGREIRPLPPFESVGLLRKNIYRQKLVEALRLEGDYLGKLARIRQTVPVYSLARPYSARVLPQIEEPVLDKAGIAACWT